MKELGGEKKSLQEALKKSIGSKAGMEGSGWRAKWSRFERSTTDWERVEAEGGVSKPLKDEYTTSKPSERFGVKKTT